MFLSNNINIPENVDELKVSLVGLVVGVMDGWITSDPCFLVNGLEYSEIVYFYSLDDMIFSVQNGTIDVGHYNYLDEDQRAGIQEDVSSMTFTESGLVCQEGGMGLIGHANSQEFMELMNQGVSNILDSEDSERMYNLCMEYGIETCLGGPNATEHPPKSVRQTGEVYYISTTSAFPPYDILSDDQTELTGASALITKVICEAADIKCELVLDDLHANCLTSLGMGATLEGKSYDLCASYYKTGRRALMGAAGGAYTDPANIPVSHYMYVADNPNLPEDINDITIDLTDLVVGVMSGWTSAEPCFEMNSVAYSTIVEFSHTEDMRAAVADGTVDVGHFNFIDADVQLEINADYPTISFLESGFTCMEFGMGYIGHFESNALIAKFDEAVADILAGENPTAISTICEGFGLDDCVQ